MRSSIPRIRGSQPGEQVAAFEAEYGPSGGWVELFSRAPGCLGTELLRDRSTPGRYLVLDRWTCAAARDGFLERWGEEYVAFSKRCESLYGSEVDLGRFRAVGGLGPDTPKGPAVRRGRRAHRPAEVVPERDRAVEPDRGADLLDRRVRGL
jgi:quinol monooxygenase YgiN